MPHECNQLTTLGPVQMRPDGTAAGDQLTTLGPGQMRPDGTAAGDQLTTLGALVSDAPRWHLLTTLGPGTAAGNRERAARACASAPASPTSTMWQMGRRWGVCVSILPLKMAANSRNSSYRRF